MLIDYISDVHIGFYTNPQKSNENNLKIIQNFWKGLFPHERAPWCIIAGDIGEWEFDIIESLKFLSENYKQVFFVFGNHDMWLFSERQRKKFQTSDAKKVHIKEQLRDYKNINILDMNIVEIDGYKIAGYSGWYYLDNDKDKLSWEIWSNDKNYIYPQGIESSQNRAIEEHAFYKSLKDIDLLITHVPFINLQGKCLANSAYYNTLIEDIDIPHIVSGHQHVSSSRVIGDTKMYINAHGYPSEDLRPSMLQIEI